MALDLFAGISVTDDPAALTWYERLLGAPPAFFPNDVEAVWELAAHRYLYIAHRPAHAGHALLTLFVDDFDARVAQFARAMVRRRVGHRASVLLCRRSFGSIVCADHGTQDQERRWATGAGRVSVVAHRRPTCRRLRWSIDRTRARSGSV